MLQQKQKTTMSTAPVSEEQEAEAHGNERTENWHKVASSDESPFLLQQSDGGVRIWHKHDMGIFSLHTLGIVDEHICSFMTTVHPSSASSRITQQS